MARRKVTAEDLRVLGLSRIDPGDLEVTIDPADLERPDWQALGRGGGLDHRRAMGDKYWDDELPDLDLSVVAAILALNEPPAMRRRREGMRERL